MRHRSGKKLWIKLVGNLTDEVINGYPISYSVMMDITEQMQLQVEQTLSLIHILEPIVPDNPDGGTITPVTPDTVTPVTPDAAIPVAQVLTDTPAAAGRCV